MTHPKKELDTSISDAPLAESSVEQERPSVTDNKEQETPFIVVSHRKHKNKNKKRSTERGRNLSHPEQNQMVLKDTHQKPEEVKIGTLESQYYSVQKALKSLYKQPGPQHDLTQNISRFKWIKSK
ncbi:23399_t:CDS:2 [Dentiscutata erythropus]|uniref:23399_t:CDS:1 n=1 Tax=Dentiscutata erythropus TaxID=1348616 RepID=A0A9N9A665_9GLOM|nr:23399_t:CDS:2 [Dentiscutata erythropus]